MNNKDINISSAQKTSMNFYIRLVGVGILVYWIILLGSIGFFPLAFEFISLVVILYSIIKGIKSIVGLCMITYRAEQIYKKEEVFTFEQMESPSRLSYFWIIPNYKEDIDLLR